MGAGRTSFQTRELLPLTCHQFHQDFREGALDLGLSTPEMDKQEHPRQSIFFRAPPSSWCCHTEAPSGRQAGPAPEPSFPGASHRVLRGAVPSARPHGKFYLEQG